MLEFVDSLRKVPGFQKLYATLQMLLGLPLLESAGRGQREGRNHCHSDNNEAARHSHGCLLATTPRSSSITSHPGSTFCRLVT